MLITSKLRSVDSPHLMRTKNARVAFQSKSNVAPRQQRMQLAIWFGSLKMTIYTHTGTWVRASTYSYICRKGRCCCCVTNVNYYISGWARFPTGRSQRAPESNRSLEHLEHSKAGARFCTFPIMLLILFLCEFTFFFVSSSSSCEEFVNECMRANLWEMCFGITASL